MKQVYLRRLFLLASVFVGNVAFAQWEFSIDADLGVVSTDNLRLQPDGLEESEVIYTVSPLFGLTTDGDRLEADLQYRPQALFFSEFPESEELFHIVDANVTSTLIREALFLNLSAERFQAVGSTDSVFPTTNLPITENRVDSTFLGIRPYWDQSLGFADLLIEYSYRDSRFDAENGTQLGAIQDNTDNSGRFRLDNVERQSGLAWALQYDYRKVEYELAVPFEYQTASAELGYWWNGTTRIFAGGGVETPFDSYLDSSLDDGFWEAGIQYAPSQRLDLEVAAGKRGFGNTYRGQLSYVLRRGRTELTYNEGAETRAEIGFGRQPISSSVNLDGILDRPGSSDRFVRKRGAWLTTIELAKSDVSVRMFSERRVQRTTDVGEAQVDEALSGIALRWSWRIGRKSTLGFMGDFAKREVGLESSKLERYSIDYAYQFSQRFSALLQAQRSIETGDQSSLLDYTENLYLLTLRINIL